MRANLKFRAGAIVRGMYTYIRIFFFPGVFFFSGVSSGVFFLPGILFFFFFLSGVSFSGVFFLPGILFFFFFLPGILFFLPSGYSLLSTRLVLSGLLLPTS